MLRQCTPSRAADVAWPDAEIYTAESTDIADVSVQQGLPDTMQRTVFDQRTAASIALMSVTGSVVSRGQFRFSLLLIYGLAMLGDLDTDATVLLRDALAWIETATDEIRRHLNDPNHHPGDTSESSASVTLSRERQEVVAMTLDITANLATLASAHLSDGAPELAMLLVVHGQACIGDAMRCLLSVSAFETVRVADEVRAMVVQDFAEKRSADARKGAPKPKFVDNRLMTFMNDWGVAHNGKMRGSQKAAALEFNVTDTAIRKRLKKIRTG